MSESAKQTVESAYQLWGEGRIEEIGEYIAPDAGHSLVERGCHNEAT